MILSVVSSALKLSVELQQLIFTTDKKQQIRFFYHNIAYLKDLLAATLQTEM